MAYTESFKLKVINEHLEKGASKELLRRKYNIPGHSTISKWIKKYADDPGTLGQIVQNASEVTMLKEKEELAHELELARIRIAALEALIEASSTHTGINLKKKFGFKR